MARADKYWALTVCFLVIVIVSGALVTWSRCDAGQPIAISQPPSGQADGSIYVDGAVNNPGIYPFKAGDSLASIIQGAGGTTAADPARLKLHVPGSDENTLPQKVNLNRAEAWLLQALPGIGQTRAQAIVDYRRRYGPFRDAGELTKVEGISNTTYERIKDLVTVGD